MVNEMQIKICPMNSSHIDGVEIIEKECFSAPWTREGIESELSNETASFFVAEYMGEVAGYLGTHIVLDECYIANVAVYPHCRRRGIGERLVRYCTDVAEKEHCLFITLEVRKSNLGAIALYEKNGFAVVGERKDFYSHPKENGLIMTKELR